MMACLTQTKPRTSDCGCWPETSVPIPKLCQPPECAPCDPGHHVLFGPGREDMHSHVFTVRSEPVVIKAIGIQGFPDAVVTLEMEAWVCGETVFEPVTLNGERAVLTQDTNIITVTGSGRYRMTLEGADPDDFYVIQAPTKTWRTMGKETRI